MRVSQIPTVLQEIIKLPSANVELWGETAQETFHYLTKPHPRIKIIQNKRWGVALFSLPDSFEEYLKMVHDEVRARRRRSERAGLHYRAFDAFDFFEDIMEIHQSRPLRQGRPMERDYLDRNRVSAFLETRRNLHGIFDKDGRLKAYAYVPILGQVFHYDRLLGHEAVLKVGVMYLMITEVVRVMIDRKAQQGNPTWAMYDTYLGASPGLRLFKHRMGFRPYKVKWKWKASA